MSVVAALPGQGFTAVLRTDDADQPIELPVVAWLVGDDGAVWPVAVNPDGTVEPVPDDVDRLVELRPPPPADADTVRQLKLLTTAVNRAIPR